jgi:cyclophilin family peptidyl-prolyl cis-trans isomerase
VQYEAREALRRLEKQPPTDHLKEIPPGITLPDVPPPVIAQVSPPPSPSPFAPKLMAPDPQSFDLESFVPPVTAFAMNQGRPGRHERVRIRTTKGDVTVTLYREWAPSTVANFLQLAESHYFDGNRWFRIVPDFVVQTGDPGDSGDGDAGYMIPAEENPIEQRSGVIAMGLNYDKNKPERDSAGTQFYITLSPQLHLDRAFTVFGEVTDGFDVLAHLVETDRIVTITEIPET